MSQQDPQDHGDRDGATGRMRDTRRFPLDRLLHIPEEVGFFVRSAIYGLGAAAVYWFMSYELAGTILLGAWGAVSLALAVLLQTSRPEGVRTRPPQGPTAQPADGPFADDTGLAPRPTLAPLEIALGAMLLLFTIPFGPAMAVLSMLPLGLGCAAWLSAANEEGRLVLDLEARRESAAGGDLIAERAAPPGPANGDASAVGGPPAAALREPAGPPDAGAPDVGEPDAGGLPAAPIAAAGGLAAILAAIGALLAALPGRRVTVPVLERLAGVAGSALAMVIGARASEPPVGDDPPAPDGA